MEDPREDESTDFKGKNKPRTCPYLSNIAATPRISVPSFPSRHCSSRPRGPRKGRVRATTRALSVCRFTLFLNKHNEDVNRTCLLKEFLQSVPFVLWLHQARFTCEMHRFLVWVADNTYPSSPRKWKLRFYSRNEKWRQRCHTALLANLFYPPEKYLLSAYCVPTREMAMHKMDRIGACLHVGRKWH